MGGGHFGILDLPVSLESGTALADFVPSSDTLLEIDNKSLTHRPDLWGHYGIAREVAAIFERPLRPLGLVDMAQYKDLPAYPLTLDDPENCPCYCCIEMTGVAALPSPLTLQYRLHALGQRTFNILVDLTNYIMLELGQPCTPSTRATFRPSASLRLEQRASLRRSMGKSGTWSRKT